MSCRCLGKQMYIWRFKQDLSLSFRLGDWARSPSLLPDCGTGETGDQKNNRDHPDHSIIKQCCGLDGLNSSSNSSARILRRILEFWGNLLFPRLQWKTLLKLAWKIRKEKIIKLMIVICKCNVKKSLYKSHVHIYTYRHAQPAPRAQSAQTHINPNMPPMIYIYNHTTMFTARYIYATHTEEPIVSQCLLMNDKNY